MTDTGNGAKVEERAAVVMHNGKVAKAVEAHSTLAVVEMATAAEVREVVERYNILVLAAGEKVEAACNVPVVVVTVMLAEAVLCMEVVMVVAAVLCTEVVMVAGVAQDMAVEGEVN